MQKQRLKQEAKLKLSPQQIQFMNLLQIPLVYLEKRIEDELESNPALEEETAVQEKAESSDDNNLGWESNNSNYNNQSTEERNKAVARERELSLQEFLLQQLPMQNLNDDERILAEFIIGCLDDNGFLNRTLLSITDDLLFKLNLNVDETALLPILKAIQKLEPTGVGARNLKECLIIQLEHKTTSRSVELAKHILTNIYRFRQQKL